MLQVNRSMQVVLRISPILSDSGGLYVLRDADGILNSSDAGVWIYVSPDGKTRTTIADDDY